MPYRPTAFMNTDYGAWSDPLQPSGTSAQPTTDHGDAPHAVGMLGGAPADPPPSEECLELARTVGRLLERKVWIARRESGWRIYCRYRGAPIPRETSAALFRSARGYLWETRSLIDWTTVRLTFWVDVPAGPTG
ncbi:hypothetical protein [Kitasatospora sp. HPMI-4]|uniref:hypothetical protein n=1 Tax=Kitasatospora sp. HPMI-4 TaxID=3448443 RepID=UPI003F1C70D7